MILPRFIQHCTLLPAVLSLSVIPALSQISSGTDPFQKALTALQQNHYAEALEDLTDAEREHPGDPRVHNFRGIALAAMGKNDSAIAEYRESVRLDPRMEDAYRNLGFLEWMEHQLDAARKTLERAVELAPDDSFAHYYLGRVLLDAKSYERAIPELETSHVPLPKENVDFSIQMATAFLATGRQEDARNSLNPFVNAGLKDSQALQVASLLLSVHDNQDAVHVVEQLAKDSPKPDEAWRKLDLALVYLLSGRDHQAIDQAEAYRIAIGKEVSKSTESSLGWSLIGIAYAHLNQGEKSVSALRQAAALDTQQEENWLNLTRELMELNRYTEAITAVQNGLAANPKSYALHLRLGAAQLSAGHYAEAESAFRDLVAAGDPLPTSYLGLAQVLLRTGRAQEAVSELTTAEHKLGPNFLISYFRGLALDRAGKTAEARAAFQEALGLKANSAEAHLSLGKTNLALANVNDAVTELQETLRLSPGNIQAKRLLSQAYRRAGDSKNATKFAEASTDQPAFPEGDLLDDFFLPPWQFPAKHSSQ